MTGSVTNGLPKGWVLSILEQVCYVQGGYSFKSKDYQNSGLPLLRISNINNNRVSFDNDTVFLPNQYQSHYSNYLLEKEDIVIALSGATTGKFGIYEIDEPALLNQRVGRLKYHCRDSISNLYLFYYMEIIRQKILQKAYGAAQPNIGTEELARFALPLPPLPEQHRIVSKLEELFSRLDAGVEALNAIKLQLKRYRQAVLKAAFEGKLTAEWREAHKGELEPASVLLENIKLERKKSGKYKELPPLDTSNLPELPEGWGWTRVGELGSLIQYGTSDKANEDSRGIPIIRMGNIQDGKLVLDNLKYMPYDYPELNDFLLHDGDILFNRTNSAELVGKSAVYNSSCPKAIFASYLIRIKLKAENYLPEILSNYINSCYGRAYIGSVVSQQVGQANVNGTKLSLMPVPLFPLDEQKKVYEIINLCFSLADKIEEVLQRCLKQSDRLRQSILKTAFEGKLVPQDPSDEPAELLLERIKAERIQKQAATLKPRKKIRNNTSAK